MAMVDFKVSAKERLVVIQMLKELLEKIIEGRLCVRGKGNMWSSWDEFK